ncbi:hypothetical protein J6590_070046 [Homalodisca vitripennis]|nr:hypothetical protein J6590_070046 [Homalodisca vitripennis]
MASVDMIFIKKGVNNHEDSQEREDSMDRDELIHKEFQYRMLQHEQVRYLNRWIAAQIETDLDQIHADSSPSLKIVHIWIHKFNVIADAHMINQSPDC